MKRSRRKAKSKNQEEIAFLNNININNTKAMEEGPIKKKWSTHDLKNIKALTPAQEDMFHAFYNEQHICAHGSAGTGKAQPLHSKILTPTGWTTMGEISEGDYVSTPDGQSAKVVGVYPQGQKNIFTITFHDGSKTECCEDHLWTCWFAKKIGYKTSKHVIDTKQLMLLLENGVSVRIPLHIPNETPNIDLPMDPYLLGILLGDGCISQKQVMFSTADISIVKHITDIIKKNGYLVSDKASGKYDYRLVSNNPSVHITEAGKYSNMYANVLQNLALMGTKSDTKFVPQLYRTAGSKQKWELIRGLMDADGTVNVNKRGGRDVSFCTTSRQLAKDMQYLVWSLGGTATIGTKYPTYTHNGEKRNGKVAYNVQLMHQYPQQFFNLERKKQLCHSEFAKGKLTLRRQVSDIKLTSFEEAQCIAIDHPDHLYITDDFIVTHNTFLALYLAFQEILDARFYPDHIIIVRSNVATRDVGHLPGTLDEKMSQYEAPYRDMCAELFGRFSTYDNMKQAGLITFMPTSFVRGLTWNRAVVIVEEGQNLNFHEINSIMTRIGMNTKVIFTGDRIQTDLTNNKEKQGMHQFMNVISNMDNFADVLFTKHDIVRSEFVKSWIIATESIQAA